MNSMTVDRIDLLPDMTLIFIFKKEYIIFVKYVF